MADIDPKTIEEVIEAFTETRLEVVEAQITDVLYMRDHEWEMTANVIINKALAEIYKSALWWRGEKQGALLKYLMPQTTWAAAHQGIRGTWEHYREDVAERLLGWDEKPSPKVRKVLREMSSSAWCAEQIESLVAIRKLTEKTTPKTRKDRRILGCMVHTLKWDAARFATAFRAVSKENLELPESLRRKESGG